MDDMNKTNPLTTPNDNIKREDLIKKIISLSDENELLMEEKRLLNEKLRKKNKIDNKLENKEALTHIMESIFDAVDRAAELKQEVTVKRH